MNTSRPYRKPRPARHLCIWPERRVPRAPHAPEGRTLHILDLENLCGGPDLIPAEKDRLSDLVGRLAGIRKGDQIVVGVNPHAWLECRDVFSGARLVGKPGPDGADEALLAVLADVGWIAERYDRVVIGSGDHCFTFIAAQLSNMGIMVGVVAREGAVSKALSQVVGFVRVFKKSSDRREVA